MSEGNSGWPDMPASPANPAKLHGELAPLAPLAADDDPPTRDAHGRFLTGNSGGGRKRGSRNRLTETFIAAVEADFAEYGPDALAKLRDDDPAAYLRIVASLVPRDLILQREQQPDFSELTPQETHEMIESARHSGMIAKWLDSARRGY